VRPDGARRSGSARRLAREAGTRVERWRGWRSRLRRPGPVPTSVHHLHPFDTARRRRTMVAARLDRVHPAPPVYSDRNATAGWMRLARRAGNAAIRLAITSATGAIRARARTGVVGWTTVLRSRASTVQSHRPAATPTGR